ncbi:hypothetical protein ES703_53998 [subsurface metagenome]
MQEEKVKFSPAVVLGLGLGAAVVAVVLIYAVAQAAPQVYTCPYCGATFDTYEELVAHVQSEHPGERIPIHIIWQ